VSDIPEEKKEPLPPEVEELFAQVKALANELHRRAKEAEVEYDR